MLVFHLLRQSTSSGSSSSSASFRAAMLSTLAAARPHVALHSGSGCSRQSDEASTSHSSSSGCQGRCLHPAPQFNHAIGFRQRSCPATSTANALPQHWQPGSLRRFVQDLATDGRYSEDTQLLPESPSSSSTSTSPAALHHHHRRSNSPPHSHRSNSPPPLRAAAFGAMPLLPKVALLRGFVRDLATDGRYSEDNQPLEAAAPSQQHNGHRSHHSPPPMRAASFAAMPLPQMSSQEQQSSAAAEDGAPRMSRQQAEAVQEEGEVHSLNVAIGANILILGAKVYVHLLTGSSSMLAEALHSLADVGNQALLRVGVAQASRAPTALHPYGYTRDRFIWALISAVGIFFLGAGASFIHGVHTLFESRVLEPTPWTYGVISVSLLLEGYSLWVATRTMMASARTQKMTLLEYIRSGASPTTTAVMLEDGGAVAGLLIAGGSTALSDLTGNPMWDAGGSMMVGGLLGVIAAYLVQRNRQVLIGRSMNKREVHAVLDLLQQDPVVSHVLDTKTEEVGPNLFRFKAEVAWNGDTVVQRYMERVGRERLIKELRTALDSSDARAIDNVLKDYGRDIISAVGAEVDRLESHIQDMNPGIKWVDLETDRGRATTFSMHHTMRHTPAKQRSSGSKPDSAHATTGLSSTASQQQSSPSDTPQAARNSSSSSVTPVASPAAASRADAADHPHVSPSHAAATSAAPQQHGAAEHLRLPEDVLQHMDAFALAPAPLPAAATAVPAQASAAGGARPQKTSSRADVASQQAVAATAASSLAGRGGRGTVEDAGEGVLDPSGQPWPHAAPVDDYVPQRRDKLQ